MIPDIPRDEWRPEIEGWSDDVLPYYRSLVPMLPRGARVVEVGVCHGRSAIFMAEELTRHHRDDVELWCIDWWTGPNFREQILPQLARRDLAHLVDRMRIVRCEGVAASRLFAPYSCDLVFIDSDHGYDGMRAHLKAWDPKVKSSGVIAGHDYDEASWPGVVKAVREYFERGVRRPTRTVWEFGYADGGQFR